MKNQFKTKDPGLLPNTCLLYFSLIPERGSQTQGRAFQNQAHLTYQERPATSRFGF